MTAATLDGPGEYGGEGRGVSGIELARGETLADGSAGRKDEPPSLYSMSGERYLEVSRGRRSCAFGFRLKVAAYLATAAVSCDVTVLQ